MSNQAIKQDNDCFIWILMLLMVAILLPRGGYAQEKQSVAPIPPLLINARQGDTPGTLARFYFGDAEKEWTIREYNEISKLSEPAILLPKVPFRVWGLAPNGYQTVPVLAFSDLNNSRESEHRLSPSAFQKHIQRLKSEGFATLSPMQLIDFMKFPSQIPRRSILLTADTESRTFIDQTVPVLMANDFTATLFIAADRVGEKDAMTWEQLEQLDKAGFTIGCRGRYGRSLTRRKKGQTFKSNFQWIESDLKHAKQRIEDQLGKPCRFLAYPEGSTSPLVSAMVAKIGFSAAFSLSPGNNPFFIDRFNIHRTIIDHRISPDQFIEQLNTFIPAELN